MEKAPSETEAPRRGPAARAMLGLLWVYKRTLSPLLVAFGVRCRHAPTCSEYAAGAVRRHGAWAGGWMTLARLSRCHPFGSSGWDPVPDEAEAPPFAPWRYGDWAWTERRADRED